MAFNRKRKLALEMIGLLLLAVICLLGLQYTSDSGELSSLDDLKEPVTSRQLPQKGFHFKLTTFIPEAVAGGYTLIPLVGAAKVVLVDMKGNVVHAWNVDADRARLLPDGNLLVVHGSKWGSRVEPWRSMRPVVAEYSWEGEKVWEYTAPDVAHHDVQRLENGNTLFPYRVIVPAEAKKSIYDQNRRSLAIRSDAIVEVTPEGNKAWEWQAHDVLDLNSCGQRECRDRSGEENAEKGLSDWTHINTTSIIPENKWYDGGDKRFKPGNIITLPRNWWTIFIVDRESGETVWEYTGDYRGGLSGGHESHMIPPGFPGEGNILVFDNGRIRHKGESFILEIDPITKKVVWVYDAGKEFFSNSAGSMQRFKNGNTLISEDLKGRVFEVTPAKEIVWELKTKFRLSRSHRYFPDYCPQLQDLAELEPHNDRT